jgi:hypothetical protein
MGHSSRSPGKLGTPGRGLMAKAPSLWKDGTKGTQRTRKLSTGECTVELEKWEQTLHECPWRPTKGAAPCAVKVARTVLNGGMRKRTARQRALSLPNWNVEILIRSRYALHF